MRQIEKLDKYVVLPNVGFYGGFIYDGEDIFLCEDHDVDEGYDFIVKQEIKDNILYTDLTKEYVVQEKKVKEVSHIELEVKEGDLIVYVEGLGYTIPEKRLCTIAEAQEIYGLLNNSPEEKEEAVEAE